METIQLSSFEWLDSTLVRLHIELHEAENSRLLLHWLIQYDEMPTAMNSMQYWKYGL